jgi:hypothetical protein
MNRRVKKKIKNRKIKKSIKKVLNKYLISIGTYVDCPMDT